MEEGNGLILRALEFAARKHRDQRRKDPEASPYINHPIALANVLCNEAGITDPVVITAAVLHDTVEDTDTSAEELQQEFGATLSSIVMEVSDDKALPKSDRKRLRIENAETVSEQAKLVILADKICNLRDLAASPPMSWSAERIDEYFNWAKAVIGRLRGTHPKLEQLFDEVYARRL